MQLLKKNEHFDAYSKAERPLNSNKKNKTTTSAILYVTDLDKRYNAKCLDWSKSLEAGAYFYGKFFWKLTSIEQSSELSFLDYPVTDQPNKFLHELVARALDSRARSSLTVFSIMITVVYLHLRKKSTSCRCNILAKRCNRFTKRLMHEVQKKALL